MWLLAGLLIGAAALIAWEVWICEGAHLGRRAVVWLYDLSAGRYDRIKSFDPDWESHFLGRPLAAVLAGFPDARVLDVGAGTGRVARALLPEEGFRGTLISLEPAARMVAEGRASVPKPRTLWLRGWADQIPFEGDSFDMVVCLEVLEFTPSPKRTLQELVRVLRPGGWLLITNRIGRDARLILGKTFSNAQLTAKLECLGLQDVEVFPWQVEYDLAWAQKTPPEA